MTINPLLNIGANIRRYREERGFTQEGFALHIGLDRAYYGRIERGRHNVSVKTLMMLGAKLGVAPKDFLADVTQEDCINFLENHG